MEYYERCHGTEQHSEDRSEDSGGASELNVVQAQLDGVGSEGDAGPTADSAGNSIRAEIWLVNPPDRLR